MSDFTGVRKHLALVPARVATLFEAQTAPQPFDKYYNRVPTRPISLVNAQLFIPAFSSNLNLSYVGQVNYALPQDLYFPMINWAALSLTMVTCIRFRKGANVTRYILGNTKPNDPFGYRYGLQAPLYNQQLIKKNFVIEFWRTSLVIGGTATSNNLNITISLVEIPFDSSQVTGTTYYGAQYTRVALPSFNFPEPIPTHYVNDPWLDNP